MNELNLSELGVSTREESINELLDKFKLNWRVEKQPLTLPSGAYSGYEAIVRSNDQNVFAVCTPSYEVFQNSEMLELVNEAAGKIGLNINKGGSFKNGALVYVQLEDQAINGIGKNKDSLMNYISAMSSHDGSLALKWGITNITISCQNTFWLAVKGMQNTVKHTQSMHQRIADMIKTINVIQKKEKTLFETYFRFAETLATKEDIKKVIKLVLDVDLAGGSKTITAYKHNRLGELSGAINSEMKQKGESLWGLFSGVIKYTTHVIPGTEFGRMQSKAVGMSNNIDNKVFNELELVLR